MIERAAFAALVLVAAGMLALSVGLWSGYLVTDGNSAGAAPEPRLQATARADARPVVATARLNPATITLWARSGPCWLSVRMDSPTGKRLFVGTLRRGRALRFTGERIWLRIGAAERLRVSLNGRPIKDFPVGVAEITVTAERIARV